MRSPMERMFLLDLLEHMPYACYWLGEVFVSRI